MKGLICMCDICHKSPCDSRCPNAPDPATIYECEYCKQPIVTGDYYYNHDGKYYHEDCYYDAAPSLIVEEESLTAVIPEEETSEEKIAVCPICNEPILKNEDRWVGSDIMYHHECIMDNAVGKLKDIPLIAENYD